MSCSLIPEFLLIQFKNWDKCSEDGTWQLSREAGSWTPYFPPLVFFFFFRHRLGTKVGRMLT